MFDSDKRILDLISILITLNRVKNESQFCIKIKFHKQSLTKVKNGKQHFTAQHISRICEAYNINANWIFYPDCETIFNDEISNLEVNNIVNNSKKREPVF